MQVIDFFESADQAHWLEQLKKCDWDAGLYLHELLSQNSLLELIGRSSRVLMLIQDDELVSFCTLAEKDDVQPTSLTPWIGWVYTFPENRGNRYAGKILSFAEDLAKKDGKSAVYISTNHEGLYEKYGYEFLEMAKDISGDDTRIYIKKL